MVSVIPNASGVLPWITISRKVMWLILPRGSAHLYVICTRRISTSALIIEKINVDEWKIYGVMLMQYVQYIYVKLIKLGIIEFG